jgi:predicted lipid-binding transport protein (Tim44 family)
MIGIIIFAMIALFLGLRLYAVLGKRNGHEQPLSRPAEDLVRERPIVPTIEDSRDGSAVMPEEQHMAGADSGLRAIAAADRSFSAAEFLEGARQAYRLILEAFWAGKEEDYRAYVSDDVREAFGEDIAERTAQGHVLDNRMVRIERAVIADAKFSDGTAEITVRFDADIAAVTRDTEGKVIAGSLTDAVPTHDAWTFARNLRSSDPNWLLTDTDEAA